jgi:hypothetical protein
VLDTLPATSTAPSPSPAGKAPAALPSASIGAQAPRRLPRPASSHSAARRAVSLLLVAALSLLS